MNGLPAVIISCTVDGMSTPSGDHREDDVEGAEGGLTPAVLEQVETRVMERLLARLTPGASEGTSSTAAEGEPCGMSVGGSE